MKTTKTLIAAITGMALLVGAAHAQYKATGADGITASPKLRETINSRTAVSVRPTVPVKHLCSMCKDEYTARVEQTAKGMIKPSVLVEKHLCTGCETKTSKDGQGKVSREVVMHQCVSGDIKNTTCCAPKT